MQVFKLSFSLKITNPARTEARILPTLRMGKNTELSKSPVSFVFSRLAMLKHKPTSMAKRKCFFGISDFGDLISVCTRIDTVPAIKNAIKTKPVSSSLNTVD